ncbi:STAS domain-containing protein [Amycolatopsis sp. MEPSY49]|uniref:STAS domain-containing protein n=1 Tax=Amycolatopsis sp. MEPSY49 TaxID=3151600 RepID=UPI003EF4256A
MESASPPMLAITVRSIGDVAVVDVEGDVDHVVRAMLREAMAAALARAPRVLVADLTRVRFFGSVGLSALAWLHQAATFAGIEVRLVATQRSVLMPLAITRVDDLFAVHSTVEDAVGPPPVSGNRHREFGD